MHEAVDVTNRSSLGQLGTHEDHDDDRTSIEKWLDSVKPGYGERFAQVLRDYGCATVGELAHLTEEQLEGINDALKEIPGSKLSTRRRIRSALRSHYAVIDEIGVSESEIEIYSSGISDQLNFPTKAIEMREAAIVDSSGANPVVFQVNRGPHVVIATDNDAKDDS